MAVSPRRKTSFEVDFAKVDAARDILGTRSLTETVDAALEEVIRVRQRRELVELLFEPGTLDPDVPTRGSRPVCGHCRASN